ncbi:MAG: very short patch repair endonuclease [Candidatus Omnitrophica bacterium]|nr:very short patch repair endonuclease [Candidatus Omnitrophota bacterium]
MDNVSKEKRSQIMSLIKSKDTKIERDFRKTLSKSGYRYRKNVKNYYGKPDIVLKRQKTVIFIDSCFWHGCAKHCRVPSSRKKYWVRKIESNKIRDRKVNSYYKKTDWRILRIWEHSLKNPEKIAKSINSRLNRHP